MANSKFLGWEAPPGSLPTFFIQFALELEESSFLVPPQPQLHSEQPQPQPPFFLITERIAKNRIAARTRITTALAIMLCMIFTFSLTYA